MSGNVEWEGKYLRIVREGTWEFVERCGGVHAVVIFAEHDGKVVLVEQRRVPLGGRKCLEMPAGLVGVISGEAQLMFAIMQAGYPYVKAGRLRALGVTSAKRSSSAPEVPTISEAGVPGYEFISWNAIHVPARTPKAIVTKIQADVIKALAAPDVRKRMFGLGMEAVGSTPGELAELVRSDIAKWSKVIKDAGVRVQ